MSDTLNGSHPFPMGRYPMIVAWGLFGALINVAAAQRRRRVLVACCVAAMSVSVSSVVQAQQKASIETVARMLKLLEGSGYHYTKVTDSTWSITFKGTKKESVAVLAIADGDDLFVLSVIADRVELDNNASALRALLKGNGNLPDGVSVLLDGDDDYIVQTRKSLKQMNAATFKSALLTVASGVDDIYGAAFPSGAAATTSPRNVATPGGAASFTSPRTSTRDIDLLNGKAAVSMNPNAWKETKSDDAGKRTFEHT